MPRRTQVLGIALVALVGCSCTDRPLDDDDPPPDIDGLCQVFCERFFECGPVPEDGPIQTVEACIMSCRDRPQWDKAACMRPREALYVCLNQYECPEFARFGHCGSDEEPDTQCCPEIAENAACN